MEITMGKGTASYREKRRTFSGSTSKGCMRVADSQESIHPFTIAYLAINEDQFMGDHEKGEKRIEEI